MQEDTWDTILVAMAMKYLYTITSSIHEGIEAVKQKSNTQCDKPK